MNARKENAARAAFWLILALGIGLRVWQFGAAPRGMNQDEAFAAYEAWSMLQWGIDSAGYVRPVYLTAWGSGMNALESYFMMPFLALFGRQIWAARLPQLLVGCLSIPALYAAVRRCASRESALWAMLVLAVCPWHVMLSRWALESNLAPGFLLFGSYCFLRGTEEARFLPLAGLLYGLALYAYATIWPVLPAVLLLQGWYCVRHGRLRMSGWLLSALVILGLLALPLLLFLAVNLGWIPEIRTPLLSIPKLLYLRSEELSLRNLPGNLKNLAQILWTQSDGLPWNSGGPWGLLFPLSLPFTGLGLINCLSRLIRSRGRYCPEVFLLIWLLASLCLGALVTVNVNRINILFLPLIVLTAMGLRWFSNLFQKPLWALLAAAYLLCTLGFARWYFDREGYQRQIGYSFGYGLEEAMAAAQTREGEIVLDGHIYYPNVLFFTGMPVDQFRQTVRYRSYPAAYLSPLSFGRFRFGYEGGAAENGACYLLSPWTDSTVLAEAGYTLEHYGIYTLASKEG